MDQSRVDITQIAFLSCNLEKNFFYIHPLEDSYIVHEHIGASFLFLRKKDFDIFHVIFLKVFLCFIDNSYLSFLYIEKKTLSYEFYMLHELCKQYELCI